MAKYFYASRPTKDGYLVTSYGNAASQKKYGGADAKHFTGLRGAEFDEEGQCHWNEEGRGEIIRSYMKSNQKEMGNGNFIIYGERAGRWKATDFRLSSYGAANTIMKAIAPMYDAVMIIEEGVDNTNYVEGDEEPAYAGVPF